MKFKYGDLSVDVVYDLIGSMTKINLADLRSRPLIVAEVRAAYGDVSHWVLSVEGTPPRGTIIFCEERYITPAAWLILQDRIKRITGKKHELLSRFVELVLRPSRNRDAASA